MAGTGAAAGPPPAADTPSPEPSSCWSPATPPISDDLPQPGRAPTITDGVLPAVGMLPVGVAHVAGLRQPPQAPALAPPQVAPVAVRHRLGQAGAPSRLARPRRHAHLAAAHRRLTPVHRPAGRINPRHAGFRSGGAHMPMRRVRARFRQAFGYTHRQVGIPAAVYGSNGSGGSSPHAAHCGAGAAGSTGAGRLTATAFHRRA